MRSILFAARAFAFAGACLMAATAFGTAGAQTIMRTVRTTGGLLQGEIAGGVEAYRGIPYAAPPVGALRWQPPAPPAPWNGTRVATAFGNSCPQGTANGLFASPSTTEDCLYLNVFAPASAAASGKKTAVIVWFPGGGLVGGSSSDYDASGLVTTGNVIVVSVNYRVGALGFFAHPGIDAEGHAAGDYGVMDQQYALQWVRRNIAAFGGDPANVTIAGESAGALTVLVHLVAPASAHLYSRVIMESSGTPPVTARGVPDIAVAETNGTNFATAAGCADAACLRALPVEKIIATQAKFRFGLISGANTPMPVGFHAAFTSGSFARVPVLTGTNRDEWRWFVANVELITGKPLAVEAYPSMIASFFGAQAAPAIVKEYAVDAFPGPSEATGAAETDGYMACGTLKLADWISPLVPVYDYQFVDPGVPLYMPPVSFPYGTPHTSELQFLFPGFHGGVQGERHALNAGELALAQQMQRYWTNFAKHGNPNGPSLAPWPAFTTANNAVLTLTPGKPVVSSDFATQHRCAFWDSLNNY